jgi:hypothetical protein
LSQRFTLHGSSLFRQVQRSKERAIISFFQAANHNGCLGLSRQLLKSGVAVEKGNFSEFQRLRQTNNQ